MQTALVVTGPSGHWFLRQDVDLQPGPASPVIQEFSTAKRAHFVSGRAGLSGYVAEIGASILGAHLSLPPEHLHDHASYIGHWMKLLKDDKRAFLAAAAQAQSAVDWLLAKSPVSTEHDSADDAAAREAFDVSAVTARRASPTAALS